MTTMRAKAHLLDDMNQVLCGPGITSRRATRTAAQRTDSPVRVVRMGRSGRPPAAVSVSDPTWSETRAVVGRELLRGSLVLAAAASVGWLLLITVQFFLAWQSLALWLRAALL